MKCFLYFSNFLEEILVFPILLFSSILLHWSLRKALLSLLIILWNSAFKWVYFSFSSVSFTCPLFTAIYKAYSDNHFDFLHFLQSWIEVKWKCALISSCLTLQHHGLYPDRLLFSENSPGKNTELHSIRFSRGPVFPRDQTWSPTLQADCLLSEPPGKSQHDHIYLIHKSHGKEVRYFFVAEIISQW